MRFLYPIALRAVTGGPPEDRGFTVAFPDLPEALTWGDTRAEALVNAVDCLEEALAARILARESLPAPSPARGRPTVAPGGQIAAKAALYLALKRGRIRPAELARRLRVPRSMVNRLLDPRHASRPKQLDAAFAALGKRLVVSLESAA